MNPFIPSILSLHEEKYTKEKSKKDMYNIVLNKCVEKILQTNRQTDKTFVIFEVPSILIGYPFYDMQSCTLFLIEQLKCHKYIVEFIEPCFLYIDWGSPSKDSSNIRIKSNKLQEQTRMLLRKFPDTSKVEYVYADDSRAATKGAAKAAAKASTKTTTSQRADKASATTVASSKSKKKKKS